MKLDFATFRIALAIAGFAVVFGLFATIGYYYVRFGEITPSESNDYLASREAVDGRVPCRDFAYTDMPMAPYLSGALAKMVGSSLEARRISNLVVAALSLLIVIAGMRRRLGTLAPALAAAFAAAASPAWIYLQAQGTNDLWSGFFLALAFSAAVADWPFKPRLIVFAVSASLAAANDLMILPALAALAAAAVVEMDTAKRKLAFGVVAAIALLALPALSFLLAGSKAFYFNWTYQWAAEPESRSIILGFDWWRISPGAILVFATGIFGLGSLWKGRRFAEILLLVAALFALSIPPLPNGAAAYAIEPAVPIVAGAGVAALWASFGLLGNHFKHVVWVLPAVALVYPLPTMTEDDADKEIAEVAAAIKEIAGKGPVLCPLGAVTVEADREALQGTERGMFSVMSEDNSKLARHLNMVTLDDLTDSVKDKEAAAVVTMRDPLDWNFNVLVPKMEYAPYKHRRKFSKALKRSYRVAYGSDTMEVMVPKD